LAFRFLSLWCIIDMDLTKKLRDTMSVLEIRDLSFGYDANRLFHDATLRLFEGDHAVLVGPNGSGKTTLLKLLYGTLIPDKGALRKNHKKRVGYLDQYAKIDGNLLVEEYLYEVYADLFEKERRMEDLYTLVEGADSDKQERYLTRASEIGEELLESGFYAVKSEIGKILGGLGLSTDLLKAPIRTLSAGMRAKVILTKLLLEKADVLLLDEPTNFLDVEHIDWLSKFLNAYEKAFIVVSHHEGLLRDIAQTVFAIEYGQITRYKGDFDYYLRERELRQEQQLKAFESQQKFIKRTEEFIQKNITRASTSHRAKSRRKMLEKLERVEPPKKDRTYKFHFPLSRRVGHKVLVVDGLDIGYDTPLVETLDLEILREDKVVITGENGIGKTTFLKTVLGDLNALQGNYTWSDTKEISYFAQDGNLNEDLTPFETIREHYPKFTRGDIMALLAAHGIDASKARRKLKTLSGGELTKTRLALLRHVKSNVLILDEPTNHLDAKAKKALKRALMEYEGTLILVSHERDFYEDICDYEIALSSE